MDPFSRNPVGRITQQTYANERRNKQLNTQTKQNRQKQKSVLDKHKLRLFSTPEAKEENSYTFRNRNLVIYSLKYYKKKKTRIVLLRHASWQRV